MPLRKHLRPIEIRDARLRGGRLSVSARAANMVEWRLREAAVRALLKEGEIEILERLRRRKLRIEDVQRAHQRGDLAPLRVSASHSLRLEDVLTRQMERVEGLLESGSVRAYASLRNQLLAKFGPDRDISTILTADAEQFLTEPKSNATGWKDRPRKTTKAKTAKPWSAGRQETMCAIAGGIWEQELQHELELSVQTKGTPRLSFNPWKKAKTKGERRPRVAFLKESEWQAVEAYLRQFRPERLVVLALGTLAGLRLGEALNLRVGIDVDMMARMIRVQPRAGEGRWVPKNKLGVRDVPMSDELYAILTYHLQHFAGVRYLIRLPGKDRPISQPVIQSWVRDAFEAVGLTYGRGSMDGLTMHSTRHTFASWLAQRRFTSREIAELIGDSPKEVDRTYSHLSPRNLREAVQAVGKASRKLPHESSAGSSGNGDEVENVA